MKHALSLSVALLVGAMGVAIGSGPARAQQGLDLVKQAVAAQGGAVTAHVKAWQELRNKQVHPSVGPLDNPASRDFQEQLDLVHQVTVLMYHIVFHLIGYRGKYTDYATLNFPNRDYPPSGPPANNPVAPSKSAEPSAVRIKQSMKSIHP